METIKDILNFCKSAVFYDYKNIGIIMELNKVRKFVINHFYETIPPSRRLVSLSISDDKISTIIDNDVDDIFDKLHDLRENVLYMIGIEKLVREETLEEKNKE